jgi:hypothetical protein
MAVILKVRQSPLHGWVTKFSAYGWKVRYNGAWLQMTPANTKVRSADGTAWLSVQ